MTPAKKKAAPSKRLALKVGELRENTKAKRLVQKIQERNDAIVKILSSDNWESADLAIDNRAALNALYAILFGEDSRTGREKKRR